MFNFRHINRLTYPQKHILICDDVITNQKNILNHFHDIFDPEGLVQISVVPGAVAAAAIISSLKIDLIILDHDMPQGNGTDLLNWMKSKNYHIPVITFSGIPFNNENMITLGANYLFGKNDVVTGKADLLIKRLLGLNTNIGIAEMYVNTVSPNNPIIPRYWVTPELLVGGDIIDHHDYMHLTRDFGIQQVINVDGRTDLDKGIGQLLECPVNDDGTPFPKDYIKQVVQFATPGIKTYIHCHMGISRSSHFAYAILRYAYKMSPEEALATIKNVLPVSHIWGFNQHTASYMKSIEDALKDL